MTQRRNDVTEFDVNNVDGQSNSGDDEISRQRKYEAVDTSKVLFVEGERTGCVLTIDGYRFRYLNYHISSGNRLIFCSYWYVQTVLSQYCEC